MSDQAEPIPQICPVPHSLVSHPNWFERRFADIVAEGHAIAAGAGKVLSDVEAFVAGGGWRKLIDHLSQADRDYAYQFVTRELDYSVNSIVDVAQLSTAGNVCLSGLLALVGSGLKTPVLVYLDNQAASLFDVHPAPTPIHPAAI